MNNKKWIRGIFIGITSVLLFHIVFLYAIDTHSIANIKSKKVYTVPNQRFAIVEYLLQEKEIYDTFIFGSSRVESINPNNFTNNKAYNLTVGAGIPHEHLLLLKVLLKYNIKIKHIYLSLDDFSPQVSISHHNNSFNLKSHYLATGMSKIKFYMFYFMRTIKNEDIKHFKKKYLGSDNTAELKMKSIQDLIINQKSYYNNKKYEDTYSLKHISDKKFKKPTIVDKGDNLTETLMDIKQIIRICNKNNITYNIVVNPIHKTTYNAIDLDYFNNFKKQLSYITSYYDFSIPNKINNNNQYWHETSHHTLEVGDMIFSRIYDNNTSIKDFGIYVEKQQKVNQN